jgi:signal-transduction protein with cAMP-binding, CBS, and nucleotidyltransferase domain
MNHKEITDILRMSDLFSELSDNELQSIADLCQIEEFEAGDIIYRQGSIGTKLYILAKGHVILEREIDLGGARKAKLNVFSLIERANRRLMGSWYTLVGEQHVHMCSAICEKPTKMVSVGCFNLRSAMDQDSTIRIKILEQLVLLLRDRILSSYEAVEAL